MKRAYFLGLAFIAVFGVFIIVPGNAQDATSKKFYPGTGISGFGAELVLQPAGRSGLYTEAGVGNSGGDQWVQYLSSIGQYLLLRNNRDIPPYLWSRLSEDGEFFPITLHPLSGNPPQINGVVAIPRNNDLGIFGFEFTGGVNGDEILTATSKDQGQSATSTGTIELDLTKGPNRKAIKLKSGTWLMPVHWRNPATGNDVSGVLRSTDGGYTWNSGATAQLAGAILNEPAIVEIGKRVLMIMRREGSVSAQPFHFSWISGDGQILDTQPAPMKNIKAQTRVGGSPSELVKLRDGRIILLYHPGSGEGYYYAYSTKDGKRWQFVGNIDATEIGVQASNRYIGATEHHLKSGRILVASGEPDVADSAIHQFSFWVNQPLTAKIEPLHDYINRLSTPRKGKVYFDLYITKTANGEDAPRPAIVIEDAEKAMARWDVTFNGNITYYTGDTVQTTSREFHLNKERLLRIIYDIDNGKLSYVVNDYEVATDVSPMTGWSAGRLPDRIVISNQNAGQAFEVREFSVYQILRNR